MKDKRIQLGMLSKNLKETVKIKLLTDFSIVYKAIVLY